MTSGSLQNNYRNEMNNDAAGVMQQVIIRQIIRRQQQVNQSNIRQK